MYIIIQVYSLLSEYDAGLGSHHSLMFVSKNAYPSLYTLSTGEVVHEFFVHTKKNAYPTPLPGQTCPVPFLNTCTHRCFSTVIRWDFCLPPFHEKWWTW